MLKRCLTALAMAVIMVPIMFWRQETIFFVILFSFIATVAEFEILRCLDLHKNIIISVPIYVMSALCPFAARYLPREMFLQGAIAVIGLVLLIMLAAFTFSNGKVSLEQAAAAGLIGVYIAIAFCAVILLCDQKPAGKYTYMLIFVASWITDTFAYITGRLFGKHKLIPAISPKKTVEGAIGGTFFCIVSFLIFGWLLGNYVMPTTTPDYFVFGLGGLLTSLVSQSGDLIMSAIKRTRGIKDFGKILPGHGGMLDRFDSVMAVSLMLLMIDSFFGLMR